MWTEVGRCAGENRSFPDEPYLHFSARWSQQLIDCAPNEIHCIVPFVDIAWHTGVFNRDQ